MRKRMPPPRPLHTRQVTSDGAARVSARGEGGHLRRMGEGHKAYPAGPSYRMREDHRLRESGGGLRPQRRQGAHPGPPRRAPGAGGGQNRQGDRAWMRHRKGGADLPRQLVPRHGRVRPVAHEGEAPWAVPGRLFRHHHNRRGAPLPDGQLPADPGAFQGCEGAGRHRHP